MTVENLINALPDLSVLVRRDGTVLAHVGGLAVAPLLPARSATLHRVEALWPETVAAVIRRSIRKAIALRSPVDIIFEHASTPYELRVSPQGPDRAVCVIRRAPDDLVEFNDDTGAEFSTAKLDRRGFLKRFRASTSLAALAETPLAVALIQLDGIAEIARLIDPGVAEQVVSAAVLRLPQPGDAGASDATWYVGQLGEGLLAVVLESSDREVIEECVAHLSRSLREPVIVGDAQLHLTPHAGVAVFGQDALTPKSLVDNARAAALEAQRDSSGRVHFFSDSLRIRSLARLDSGRELRDAIANHDIRLHYTSRHELETGRRVASVGYLRWLNPIRGEVRPAEFVGIAEMTGLALALSRAALRCIGEDFPAQNAADPSGRVSFGPLRHHVLHADFVADILAFLDAGTVPAERFEVRIAERTFVATDPDRFDALAARGVHVIVDEVARRMASFDRLARARIDGLQLDRAWVTALRTDRVALKVCRAGIAVADALGITPIATGVDDVAQRDALLALGCRFGSGDLYALDQTELLGSRADPARK